MADPSAIGTPGAQTVELVRVLGVVAGDEVVEERPEVHLTERLVKTTARPVGGRQFGEVGAEPGDVSTHRADLLADRPVTMLLDHRDAMRVTLRPAERHRALVRCSW